MEYCIRFVTEADLDAVTHVEAMSFPQEEAATREAFATRIRAFPESFLVAVHNDQIIGIINGCCTTEPELGDELYEPNCPHSAKHPWQTVFGLAVLPECRHQGIARGLLNRLIDLSKVRGKAGVILTCKEEKISFYESFGFQCRGVSASSHGGAVWYDMILSLS